MGQGDCDKSHGKSEVLGTFFPSVFTRKTSLQEPQAPETGQKGWNKAALPWWRRNCFGSTYLNKPDILRPMGPVVLHP